MWGAATLHGIVLSRAALAEFRANQATNARGVPEQHGVALDSGVNFANWSIKRVQAYKESLWGKVAAPMAVLRIRFTSKFLCLTAQTTPL